MKQPLDYYSDPTKTSSQTRLQPVRRRPYTWPARIAIAFLVVLLAFTLRVMWCEMA